MTQAGWHEHAALLSGRLARLQLHIEPDWLYCLCRVCGVEIEQNPPSDVVGFRFDVATHECAPVSQEIPADFERLF
jgi:hypothetical protein